MSYILLKMLTRSVDGDTVTWGECSMNEDDDAMTMWNEATVELEDKD